MEDCIFCRIIAGQVATKLVYQDDTSVAFDDMYPKAPVHVLVVPRRHIPRLLDAGEEDEKLLGHLLTVANKISRDRGVAEPGYRICINVNRGAGQVVFHLHLHVMGGRGLD